MTLYKNKYRIESTRLQNWNYSNPGWYYVTVCINNRLNMLGDVVSSEMILNENGIILKTWLLKIDSRYENAVLDKWIIMPNHCHCIVRIINDQQNNGYIDGVGVVRCGGDGVDVDGCDDDYVETIHESSLHPHHHHSKQIDHRNKRRKMLLSKIIGYIKMNSSKHINLNMNQPGTKLWQPGYWDRIIRDPQEYFQIATYINNNPLNWEKDRLRNIRIQELNEK